MTPRADANTFKLSGDMSVHYDVDDTLVMWNNPYDSTTETEKYMDWSDKTISFYDPYIDEHISLKPHYKHIEILKRHHAQGYNVIVWSHGGVEWAWNIVDKLGLKPFVSLVMVKPTKFVDDLQAHEILGTRIYIQDKD